MHAQAKKLGIDREVYVAASDDQFPDHVQAQAFQLQRVTVTLLRMPILFAPHSLENKSYLPSLASQLLMHRKRMHKLARCLGEAQHTNHTTLYISAQEAPNPSLPPLNS